MTYSSDAAQDALAVIGQSRARLVAASDTPPLRHLAFAALMGALVALPAMALPWRFGAFALLMLGVALVVRWDRRRTGMFINGYRGGRTLRVTLPLLAIVLALYAISTWWSLTRGGAAMPLALGLVAAVIAYGGSVVWCRVFRRELLSGAA